MPYEMIRLLSFYGFLLLYFIEAALVSFPRNLAIS